MPLLPCALLLAASLAAGPAATPAEIHESPVSAHATVSKPLEETPKAGGAGDDLFTLLDYFDAGQQRALRYLGSLTPSPRETYRLRDLSAACVRVSCETDGGKAVVFSSGVLVSGGRRVVTVAHGVGDPGDDTVALKVILTDGRSLPARLISRSRPDARDQDWAVLELVSTEPLNLTSVPVGSAQPGSVAVILGYPERVGLGPDGHAAARLGGPSMALDPLLFVARVPVTPSTELEPLAGAVPLSGASGSPVFDEHGNLVGVLVAIGRLAYPEGLRHVYRVSFSADFEAALKS